MLMSAMEVLWDLLVFLALVAVGLVVLNLMARRAEMPRTRRVRANGGGASAGLAAEPTRPTATAVHVGRHDDT
jgi:hypothetical protein